ncbi:MAG: IPT/TIG domain-containing protein, partial [Chitinophagaceae bacterium]
MRQIYVDGNQNNAISKLSFFSASNGFVAFNNWIGYTTDSGRSYSQKNITINNVNFNGYSVNLTFGFGINGVKAFDQNNVIVYGDYGFVPAILHSANGGNTFTLIYHSQFNLNQLSTGITDMVFPQNNSIGYAIDADRILKTTNQGLSWTVVRTDPGSFFSDLDAVDNNSVYAYNSDITTVKLVKTVNAGLNWTVVNLPAGNDYINCANFISADKGWLNMRTNTEGKLYQTTNGGTSWIQVNDNEATPVFAKKLKFINDTTGFAIAGIFTIYKTINSGRSWDPLPKDNNYTYLNFTHNDLQMHSNSQFWAGGAHGFLELTSNGGGTPIAKAYFKIDISNVVATGTVNLVNFSNIHYTYKWFKNGELLSTLYNSSYVHDLYKLRDTITLIVSDNNVTDTAIKYIDFPPPIFITSFTPVTGNPGTTVTISGNNLSSTTWVFFGGVPAASFSIVSPTQINAVVGQGATGHVTIANFFRRDSLPGFRFTGIAISSMVPQSGTMGDVITIRGHNFLQASSVSFGGTPASSFTIVDSTTITAVVGPGTTGNVVINAINGLATFSGFTYTGPTTITSFTPVSA